MINRRLNGSSVGSFGLKRRFVATQTQRQGQPWKAMTDKQEIYRCVVGFCYSALLSIVMLLPKLRTLR